MKHLELQHSVHRATSPAYRQYANSDDCPTHCEICASEIGALARHQRVRKGAYIYPVPEQGIHLEYVCKRCYDCSYGWLYIVRCTRCGIQHIRNQRCDGPYSYKARCLRCHLETVHERTNVHAADTSKEPSCASK